MIQDPILLGLGAFLLLLLLLLLVQLLRRPRDTVAAEVQRMGKAVEELNRLFLVPRARGPVGERILSQALADLLPRQAFSEQHTFRDGARVDAVLRLGDLMVPVDSKFPLEAVSSLLEGDENTKKAARAVEKHMQSIAEKYIRPGEGTTNFALLYIPSERIYYELFVRRPLVDGDRRVLPVGPGTLGLYLQTLTYGMGLLRMDREPREQLRLISAAKGSARSLAERFGVLQKHLNNAAAAANQTAVQLERLEQDLATLENRGKERTE